MIVEIKGDKPLSKFLEENASKVNEKYYFLPYWFEKTKDGFKLHHLEKLPEELKDAVKKLRG